MMAAVLRSAPMRLSRLLPWLAGILVMGIAAALWSRAQRVTMETDTAKSGAGRGAEVAPRRSRPAVPPPAPNPAGEQLAAVLSADAAQRAGLLEELRRRLEALAPAQRRQLLDDFFAARQDADLGGRFTVGPDGGLTASPTLRVWLMNELTRLDPAGAAALGRQVLVRMDSPDEWAVALRSVVLGDASTEARSLVKEKTLALLGHSAWQEQPSSGYLNAFDVAVHLKDREFAPVLSGLLRQTNQQALAHAAFLALDRLTIAAPVEFLGALQTQPDALAGREAARAGYFARADVTNPAQRTLLEQYLLSPDRSAEEWNSFVATFPSANQFLSHNLLTRQTIPDGATLARRDAATLAVVRQWLADPRFAAQQAHLRAMESRLREFVRQSQNQSAP